MDDVDRAQAIEATFNAHALARHHEARRFSASSTYCRGCGDEIPEARRRALQTEDCIDCATRAEAARRRAP